MEKSFFDFADGNPGALSVMVKMAERAQDDGLASEAAVQMVLMGIRGEKVWIAYKDLCDENLEHFISGLLAHRRDFVELGER